MIQLSWSNQTAEALEEYRFRSSSDPRVEWHVENGKASAEEFDGIVQYYKYESEKLLCCLCGYARHFEGAVIQLKDNTFRLVGNCCGRDHFLEDWKASTNAFSFAEKSANHRIRAREILKDQTDILNGAINLRVASPTVAAARSSLMKFFGSEYRRLANELSHNAGQLSYEVSLNGEIARQGGASALKSTLVMTSALSGWEIFHARSWDREVEDLIGRIKAIFCEIQDALDKGYSLYSKIRKTKDYISEAEKLYYIFQRIAEHDIDYNFEIIQEWFRLKGIHASIVKSEGEWIFKGNSEERILKISDILTPKLPEPFKLVLKKEY